MDRALQRFLRYHRTEGSTAPTIGWHKNVISYFRRYLAQEGLPDTLEEALTLAHARDLVGFVAGKGLGTA